jgi:4-hydroxybenzoate polyprenyltransferase
MAITKRGRKHPARPGDATGGTPDLGGSTAAVGTTENVLPTSQRSRATDSANATVGSSAAERGGRWHLLTELGPVLLLRAAHPRQALLTALGLAVAAALAGRPTRETGLVFVTALVGQAILGWHNDLVDRHRDLLHIASGKPVADSRIDPGTVWFTLACGLLLVVPLSLSNGLVAGSTYLIALAIGLLGNVALRRGLLSWLPWAASFALYPAFLSYGGWGGGETLAEPFGAPPEISMTVLAALLGVGVHVLRSLPGLVGDRADGYRSLPLRIALRTGAAKLLVLASIYTAVVLGALLVVGSNVGLAQ